MKKLGGLHVRGTGFSQEQLDGYRRDYNRLMDWIADERPTPEEDAASIARAEASERLDHGLQLREVDPKVVRKALANKQKE